MYYVYILASKRNGTLYTGITSNLMKRIYEHKQGNAEGFTKKYSVNILVYFENTDDVRTALESKKTLKKWKRQWKLALIEANNP